MRYSAKTDANQQDIVDALRAAGYKVYLTHRLGGGFPDLLCVSKSHIAVLLEVKMMGEGLNKKETCFFADYPAMKYMVRSPESALDAMQFVDEMEVV